MNERKDGPHINFGENVLYFQVERSDEPEDLTEAQLLEREQLTDKLIGEAVEPPLLANIDVCKCSMAEFMQKNERRRQLMNLSPQQYQPGIDQDDIDNFKFAVVVITKDGIPEGISAIIRECKKCHKIEYWGNIAVFARMVAEITTNFISANGDQESDEEVTDVSTDDDNPLGDGVLFEDLGNNDLVTEDIDEEDEKE